jgi:hypothetical protein
MWEVHSRLNFSSKKRIKLGKLMDDVNKCRCKWTTVIFEQNFLFNRFFFLECLAVETDEAGSV